MLSAFLAISMIASEPQLPKEEPWPGGVWAGDGKDYKPGAFKYTKKADYEKYLKDHAAWEEKHLDFVLHRKIANYKIKFDFYNLAKVVPILKWEFDGTSISATTKYAVYGGTTTLVATVSKSSVKFQISAKNVDVEKFNSGIALKLPISPTGLSDMAGTIDNGVGDFVGTGDRVSASFAKVNRLGLYVDLGTGAYKSTADTSFGNKVFNGKLRSVK